MRIPLVCLLWGLAFGAVSCNAAISRPAGEQSVTLTVMAAASLQEPFQELAALFEESHPGARVNLALGGSNFLAAQLASGAEADVFASADWAAMERAIAAGKAETEQATVFAHNELVVIQRTGLEPALSGWQDLARAGLKVVLAAREVPAGSYSRQFLARVSQEGDPEYELQVLANVVSEEQNVRQVLTKVRLGEADAGIVYASDVRAAEEGEVLSLAIPADWNILAEYVIAPVRAAAQPDLAEAFIDLVLSPTGQAVLAEHGLKPVR